MDNFDFNQGEILLVDKDLEWSSFQAVKKIKYLFIVVLNIVSKV